MANANAIVEQLKELGLRHGEKAGVAIASMAFFFCVVAAASQKTIDTSPEQIKTAAQQSRSNITRQEKRETIIQRLEEKGIKDSDFAKVVEEQVKTALAPGDYKAAREWVTPEPGAGLIRDEPKLIAVTELYAYPGRGGYSSTIWTRMETASRRLIRTKWLRSRRGGAEKDGRAAPE